MFWRFKHCFSGSNIVWALQTLFFPKKQCLKGWDEKAATPGPRYGKTRRDSPPAA
jgi:hypothetical protein